MRESDIERYFCKEAELLGAVVRKLQWIGYRGAPDRIVFHRGCVFFVEFKAPGKHLSAHQEREISILRSQGAKVFVVSEMEQAQKLLNLMRKHA